MAPTLCLYMLKKYADIRIVNVDKLTYAGNLENLKSIDQRPRYVCAGAISAIGPPSKRCFDSE